MSQSLRRNLFIAIAIIVFTGIPAVFAQNGTGEVQVSDVRVDFPRIELEVRVIQQGRAISGLTADAFTVGETHRDLTVEEIGTSSTLAVVIDTPDSLLGNELARVKEAVSLYFSDPNFYEDGTPVIIVQQYNRTYNPRTFTSRSEILSFINNLPNGAGVNRYRDGLQSAAGALSEFIEDNGGTGNILIVGAFAQAGTTDLNNTAILAQELFNERGFTTSVIHAFTGSRQRFTAGYQNIAQQGNGKFAVFDATANSLVLEDVFEYIRGEQSAYRLTYESLDASSGLHTVSLTVVVDGETLSGEFNYIGPNLIAPIVTVSGITNNETIIRLQTEDTGLFSNASREIEVGVTFPDGFERPLSEVLLEISSNGEIVDEISINSPEGSNATLTWDLSAIIPPEGQSELIQPFTLIIKAIDQYGFVGESNPINVIVQAEGIPGGVVAQPTSAPNSNVDTTFITQTAVVLQQTIDAANASALSPEDLQGTATAVAALSPEDRVATANAIAAANVNEANENAEKATDSPLTTYAPIACGVATFLFLFIAIGIVLSRRSRVSQPVPIASGGAAASNLDMMKTQVGFGAAPQAFLEVLTGVEYGQKIPIDSTTFTIGRVQNQGIHYATPAYENVSSRHCSIIYRNNEYVIVDHGSTNGTYLNGKKLEPNIETPIPPNATIQLGKDAYTSIQMRFSMPNVGGGLGEVGKTRIDIGVGPEPVDNAVWGQKTALYGQQNQAPSPPASPPPAAAPGQFFNPAQPQSPHMPPPPTPPPPQRGQQGQQKGYDSDWSGGDVDDSWLDQ